MSDFDLDGVDGDKLEEAMRVLDEAKIISKAVIVDVGGVATRGMYGEWYWAVEPKRYEIKPQQHENDILDGVACQDCGEFFKDPCGHPRSCIVCGPEPLSEGE